MSSALDNHDNARRAVAALEGGVVQKRLLKRVELAGDGVLKPLERGYALVLALDGEHRAARHGHSVNYHGTRPARALVRSRALPR